jgi:hypothetical protein
VARTARRHGNFVGTGSIGLRLARDMDAPSTPSHDATRESRP